MTSVQPKPINVFEEAPFPRSFSYQRFLPNPVAFVACLTVIIAIGALVVPLCAHSMLDYIFMAVAIVGSVLFSVICCLYLVLCYRRQVELEVYSLQDPSLNFHPSTLRFLVGEEKKFSLWIPEERSWYLSPGSF